MSQKRQEKKNTIPTSFDIMDTYCGIEEYVLKKNGLRVLYSYDDTTPVAGLMVTYLVGSRHEATGNTGFTHILEHLMFKGSKNFPSKRGIGALDILAKKGALVNASTWLDRTNYYEVLPDEHFEFALRLEADRMRNASITVKDLAEELPAVRSEYAMYENEPTSFLDEKIWATAFMAYPYHHPTIGWLSDIENASVPKLKEFYNTYYHPNNAVVTIVGNIERSRALNLVRKYFGVHKKSQHHIPHVYTVEPKQKGRRFVEVQRAGSKNVVSVAFKVPEALHADTPAILTMSVLLGGGKTSRLYRALVEKHLATEAWSSYTPFYAPSLIEVSAEPAVGVSHEQVEKALITECKKLVNTNVKDSELAQVIEQTATDMAFARDGHYAILSALNEAIAVGDWRFYFDFPKKLEKITSKELRIVARRYFQENTMTVGYYRAKKT